MAQSNTRLSPRQKMINLMYIVLTAMLALNVSSDVLDGFTQVHDGLARTNETVLHRNDAIYLQLQEAAAKNPEKAGRWFEEATHLRVKADSMFRGIDALKTAIVKKVDGPEGDFNNIENREDLDAASIIMLNPATGKGADLRQSVDRFRQYVETIVVDSVKRQSIAAALSTAPFSRPGVLMPQTWEEAKFDNQPVVAAITLLTKLQNDIRYAEGEAMLTLLSQVDAGDVRVNELNAFVIPQSRLVMRGSRYAADIVLAAVDTTARPAVFVGGRLIGNGHYEIPTGQSGTFDYSGYLEVPHGDGAITRHDFSSSYTVIEPTATVSATMMNVLYAGIDNPISISVPGVAQNQVSASMTNGTLSHVGDRWVARPSAVGKDAVITVTANMDGHPQTVNTTTFRVRKLPDPIAFISYPGQGGHTERYKGGRPLPKATLMAAKGIDAAIDDDMLNIDFRVLSFETVIFDSMGNAIPEVSNGRQFSQRQKDSFKRMGRGKRFYISRVRAVGPDGIERLLPQTVEVIVN